MVTRDGLTIVVTSAGIDVQEHLRRSLPADTAGLDWSLAEPAYRPQSVAVLGRLPVGFRSSHRTLGSGRATPTQLQPEGLGGRLTARCNDLTL